MDDDKLCKLESKVENHGARIGSLEVRAAVAEAGIAELKSDIATIKGDTRWILRLIIGAIVTAVVSGTIALVFKAIQKG